MRDSQESRSYYVDIEVSVAVFIPQRTLWNFFYVGFGFRRLFGSSCVVGCAMRDEWFR